MSDSFKKELLFDLGLLLLIAISLDRKSVV